jgi:hypothetical protein
MEMTDDILEGTLAEAIRDTPANTKSDVVLTAVDDFNRNKLCEKLAEQLGSFENVDSLEELLRLREVE